MHKQVDEKQVVFWSEKHARRAKTEWKAALVKARDLSAHPDSYTRATSYVAAKYVKKIDYDKQTGEILTASAVLDINDDLIKEEEALNGYYMLLTSEIEESDERMSGLSISTVVSGELRNPSGLQKNELEARPVYVWKKEHIEAHFLTCFIALTITRILEMKLERV